MVDNENVGRAWVMKRRESEARKLSEAVFDAIMSAERHADDANRRASKNRKEIEQDIRNEHDAENRQLRDRLRFSVAELNSEAELDAYHKFVKEHEKCRLDRKIDGGKMPYVIQYGTGIGVCTTVVCQACGAKQDITDMSIW